MLPQMPQQQMPQQQDPFQQQIMQIKMERASKRGRHMNLAASKSKRWVTGVFQEYTKRKLGDRNG